jgi:hypothetical protein
LPRAAAARARSQSRGFHASGRGHASDKLLDGAEQLGAKLLESRGLIPGKRRAQRIACNTSHLVEVSDGARGQQPLLPPLRRWLLLLLLLLLLPMPKRLIATACRGIHSTGNIVVECCIKSVDDSEHRALQDSSTLWHGWQLWQRIELAVRRSHCRCGLLAPLPCEEKQTAKHEQSLQPSNAEHPSDAQGFNARRNRAEAEKGQIERKSLGPLLPASSLVARPCRHRRCFNLACPVSERNKYRTSCMR